MSIFDKIKDALGANQHETARSAAQDAEVQDAAVDPTLGTATSDSAQATAPADSAAAEAAASVDPVHVSGAAADTTASADTEADTASDQATGRAVEPAAAQPQPAAVIEQQQAEPTAPSESASDPAATDSATYTVAEGDNLTWIGERFGVSVDDLVAANNMENPDLIVPGQVLTIPR